MMLKLPDENGDEGTSEATFAKTLTNTKEVPFFISNMDDRITPEVRNFLETYSGVPPQIVVKHVYNIREKSWAIRAYPCTGFALFLRPMLPLNPAYSSILQRIRDEEASLIDVGCFIGHDLRRLVFDGCPPNNLVGCDIVDQWDLGFEFYQDNQGPFGQYAKYVKDDILYPKEKAVTSGPETDDQNEGLKLVDFNGKMDIINAGHILHHWDWKDQVRVCKNLVALSKGPQSIIVGCQIGSTGKNKMEAHCKENPYATFETWWHSPETWRHMWAIVEQETWTKWEVEVVIMKSFEEVGWRTSDWWYIGDCARVMQWVMKRIV